MVAPRSTAWRVGTAARPSPRQRDRAVRLPSSAWVRLLGDASTVVAYHARVHRRGPGEHWFWLGPISGSGGAKLRVPAAMGGAGCSTLKWPHCSPLIWPHPGAVAAGLLHSDLAPPARLGRRIFRHAGEVPGQAGCLGGLLVTSGCRPLTVWGRDGVEGGAVRRDPLGLPAGGVRRPAAGPQAAGAGGAGAGGGRRVDRCDAARGPGGAAQAAAHR